MIKHPNTLYRFFDKEEYAQAFLDGEIRFGNIKRYKEIEGDRKDESEGKASFYWNQKAPSVTINKKSLKIVENGESNQNISFEATFLNPVYILSTSEESVNIDELKRRFGAYIVRINKPSLFLEQLKKTDTNHPIGTVELKKVIYNKNGLMEPNPLLQAPSDYSYIQKPEVYKVEKEYRYVLICKFQKGRLYEDYITLQIKYCQEICQKM